MMNFVENGRKILQNRAKKKDVLNVGVFSHGEKIVWEMLDSGASIAVLLSNRLRWL